MIGWQTNIRSTGGRWKFLLNLERSRTSTSRKRKSMSARTVLNESTVLPSPYHNLANLCSMGQRNPFGHFILGQKCAVDNSSS